jgi:hypothetical protein
VPRRFDVRAEKYETIQIEAERFEENGKKFHQKARPINRADTLGFSLRGEQDEEGQKEGEKDSSKGGNKDSRTK